VGGVKRKEGPIEESTIGGPNQVEEGRQRREGGEVEILYTQKKKK